MRIPELLVPASSLEVLQVAVIFGADAVYIGGEAFGLRAKAKNFSKEDMSEGVRFAHEHGVKYTSQLIFWHIIRIWRAFGSILKNSGKSDRMH